MNKEKRHVIAIIDDYENFVVSLDAYAMLKRELPNADIRVVTQQPLDDDAIQVLGDVEHLVLIRERTRIVPALLNDLPALKTIVQTGTIGSGLTSHVDVAACAERGIKIIEGVVSDGHSAAEVTWSLILNARRHVYSYMKSLYAGDWQQGSGAHELGRSLRGQTLGILGYGRIGQLLGRYAQAFGMDVLVWGRENTRTAATAHGVSISESREALFESSDVLALQMRLNEDTYHSVTLRDLSLMKPTALLVNTSRAALIEPGALVKALKAGKPGMAAVDVHDTEPLSVSELTALPNCIATPHIGYIERHSYETLFTPSFKKLIDYLQQTS